MKYRFYDDDGSEEELELPSKYEVCWRCQGKGVHDCWEGGMTGDEMYEQGPEFLVDYLSGVYDKCCTVCDGLRVLEVVDRGQLSPKLRRRYDKAEEERLAYEAEVAHERQMSNGEKGIEHV